MKYNITDIIKKLGKQQEGGRIYGLGTKYIISMQKELYQNNIGIDLFSEFVQLYNKQPSNRDIFSDQKKYRLAQIKKVSQALFPVFTKYETEMIKGK